MENLNLKKMKNQEFSTNDLYLASFLLAKGLQLLKVDKTEGSRCNFVFQDPKNRLQLCESFFSGGELVEPRKFVLSIKDLKQRIYSKY